MMWDDSARHILPKILTIIRIILPAKTIIQKPRMDSHIEQKITDKVGCKTESTVHTWITKNASTHGHFVTAEHSKYLGKKHTSD